MKILKYILFAILGILALLLITGIFVKKDYTVMREVTINKPKQEVFDYLKLLRNQGNYSKWEQMDPNAIKTYTGTDGTVGFISAWDSKMDDVGAGEQEIKKITEGERIDLEIRFKRPFESKSQAYLSTTAVSETQTKVIWGFEGKMNYPMNLITLVMNMEKMVGDDLQVGLENLKALMEKQ